MAPPPLLTLQDIRLTISQKPLLDGAELFLSPGARLCVVGRNGSGKSTLMKIAAGLIEPDAGQRFFQPGATLRYLPQEPDLAGFDTVLAYAEAGLKPTDDPYRARYYLNELGLQGEEEPDNLSGGEARRAALARVLAAEPDVLLLDEPTNHLDLPAIEWLESALGGLRSAIALISHDRRFLERLSQSTLWLDRGRTVALDKGFAHFEAWRDARLEEEETQRHKLDRKISAEEHWVRHGVSGRRKRNQGRLAALQSLRQQAQDGRRAASEAKLAASEGQASGALVIEAEGLTKSLGERLLVDRFSARVMRRDRVGIVGANGAGKTTLVRLLTGELAPDAGRARLGTNVEIAHLDQGRAVLRDEWTLREALTNGGGDRVTINGVSKHIIGYMKDFLFAPEQAETPVRELSGGERARVTLARALSLPSNLLVLDEPTNDLDLETLDILEETLADYPGTILVVSHDRDFLDRVATSIVFAEGEGQWIEYAGGYADMLAQRGAGVAARAAQPKASRAQKGKSASSAEPASASRRKLSFKEKHALETLPAEMDALRARADAIETAMADAELFAKDPKRFAALTRESGDIALRIAAAEERWLELEMLRESLEG